MVRYIQKQSKYEKKVRKVMKIKRSVSLLISLLMLFALMPGMIQAESADAPEEYFLEKEPGCRQLTLYWSHPSADYETCDVWIWFPGRDGRGQLFYPCDYGVKCMINVPEDVSEVGFIVRRNCSDPGGSAWGSATKDFEDDRYAVMTGEDTKIYLKAGDGMQYESPDGGKTLNPIRIFQLAGIISPTEIRYLISPAERIEDLGQIHVRQDGREIAVEKLSTLNNKVVTGVITVQEPLDVAAVYTVEIEGYGEITAVPTEIFDSADFVENFTYDGDDLGAVVQGDETVFKVWAPTASAVQLNLFEAGNDCDAYDTLGMVQGEKGVWTAQAPCGHGTYYTYTVTTALGTQEAVDPYARTVGVNGNRGMVTDLSLTDPDGFRESAPFDALSSYQDAVIWEVHVRDFSNKMAASQYPGKYLAFTETGLTNAAGVPVGVDYLRHLGVTHVHLQPVYDYATVDESSDAPQFNWGYDPKNYNAPEGSYATDPYHGEVRVKEFKQMVQGLHENGLGVVMDVVYNHTYSLDSNLNRIVPYYYYRFAYDGSTANGSGCGNETASNRVMFRKYMVDSVRYWAEEYRLDGFRFDLMALHDVETMQAIEQAVHAVNPHALIYGEGWTGGTSPLRENLRASQANIRQITATGQGIGAVAVFNDVIRDGLKGSVFDRKDTGYANGSATKTNGKRVIFGIQGGVRTAAASWNVEDAMVINYVSSHDNNTLWDKLLATNPDADEETLLAMNRLCAATVLLSRGTPFFLAGEEMLRTKQGDENSYASSDEVNNIDWEALTPGSSALQMSEYYRGLIGLRREKFADADSRFRFLTEIQPTAELAVQNAIAVSWIDGEKTVAYAVINPTSGELHLDPPEGWEQYAAVVQGDQVDVQAAPQAGTVNVAPRSVTLIVPAGD